MSLAIEDVMDLKNLGLESAYGDTLARMLQLKSQRDACGRYVLGERRPSTSSKIFFFALPYHSA